MQKKMLTQTKGKLAINRPILEYTMSILIDNPGFIHRPTQHLPGRFDFNFKAILRFGI